MSTLGKLRGPVTEQRQLRGSVSRVPIPRPWSRSTGMDTRRLGRGSHFALGSPHDDPKYSRQPNKTTKALALFLEKTSCHAMNISLEEKIRIFFKKILHKELPFQPGYNSVPQNPPPLLATGLHGRGPWGRRGRYGHPLRQEKTCEGTKNVRLHPRPGVTLTGTPPQRCCSDGNGHPLGGQSVSLSSRRAVLQPHRLCSQS